MQGDDTYHLPLSPLQIIAGMSASQGASPNEPHKYTRLVSVSNPVDYYVRVGADDVKYSISGAYYIDDAAPSRSFIGLGFINFLPITFQGVNDHITGTNNGDLVRGGSGDDIIHGGGGVDILMGGEARDSITGGSGDDFLYGGGASNFEHDTHTDGSSRWNSVTQARTFKTWDSDTLDGGEGSDFLSGDYGADLLIGGAGEDVLDGGLGNDALFGGTGRDVINDSLFERQTGVSVNFNPSATSTEVAATLTETALFNASTSLNKFLNPKNLLKGGIATYVLGPLVEAGVAVAVNLILDQVGSPDDDWLDGGQGADNLIATRGADTVTGGSGDDTIHSGMDNDLVYGDGAAEYFDVLRGEATQHKDFHGVRLVTPASAWGSVSTTNALQGNDYINSGYGYDVVFGGRGDDTIVDPGGGEHGSNTGFDLLPGEVGSSIGFDVLHGEDGNDTIGSQTTTAPMLIYGGNGNDRMISGDYQDTMHGGTGDDVYINVSTLDLLYEDENAGSDAVQTSASFILPNNIENILAVSYVDTTNNSRKPFFRQENIFIAGNNANNKLVTQLRGDTLAGGLGDDTYVGSTTIVEQANQGYDTVFVSLGGVLAANVEAMFFQEGGAVGNAADNILTASGRLGHFRGGQEGLSFTYQNPAVISGLAGNDTITVINTPGSALWGDGRNNMSGLRGQSLGLPTGTVTLSGGEGNDVLNANDQNTTLLGGNGDDVLNAGRGRDLLDGGLGNDFYRLSEGDRLASGSAAEALGGGNDTIEADFSMDMPLYFEVLRLTGLAATASGNDLNGNVNEVLQGSIANNTISGLAGSDTLTGGFGADSLIGGVGDDHISDTQAADRTIGPNRLIYSGEYNGLSNLRPKAGTGTATSEDGRFHYFVSSRQALGDTPETEQLLFRLDRVTEDVYAVNTADDRSFRSNSFFAEANGRGRQHDQRINMADPTTSANGEVVAFTFMQDGVSKIGVATYFTSTISEFATTLFSRSLAEYKFGIASDWGQGSPVIGNGNSLNPSLSADGGWIAFETLSTNFQSEIQLPLDPFYQRYIPSDNNGYWDIYLRSVANVEGDKIAGPVFAGNEANQGKPFPSMTRVSVAHDGGASNGASVKADLSGDGRYVAFLSDATNLVLNPDTNGRRDAFVRDMETGRTTRIVDNANADITDVSISKDGMVVAFLTRATNIAHVLGTQDGTRFEGVSDGSNQIYLFHRATGEMVRHYIEQPEGFGLRSQTQEYDEVIGIELASDGSNDYLKYRVIVDQTNVTNNGPQPRIKIVDEAYSIGDYFLRNNHDTMDGGAGADTLSGGSGNDLLLGGEGMDVLSGGDGEDTLDGGQGADQFSGGLGRDTYIETEGDSFAPDMTEANALATYRSYSQANYATATFDEVTLAGANALVADGTSANERFVGNSLANRLSGADGADTLVGEAGADTLFGGAGADVLQGGAGDDRLEGGAGGDTLDGGEGADTMVGGGNGTVYVIDSVGDRIVVGVTEFFHISSSVNIESTLLADYTGRGLSAFPNTVTLTGVGNVNVDLSGQSNQFYSVIGNAGNNMLRGGALDARLEGGAGADTLIGGGRRDTLDGGDGDDVLNPKGAFDDSIIGGAGNDTLQIDANWGDAFGTTRPLGSQEEDGIYAGLLIVNAPNPLYGRIFAPQYVTEVEFVSFAGVTGTVEEAIRAAPTAMVLQKGADVLTGSIRFATSLAAGDVLATINVTDRNKVFENHSFSWVSASGDVGSEQKRAMEGAFDFIGNDIVLKSGVSIADLPTQMNVGIRATGLDRLATTFFFEFSLDQTAYNLVGDAGDNTLEGQSGDDTLSGLDGADSLVGNDHADQLFGGEGADTLIGGNSADRLDGGAGADRMVGGAGNDFYLVDDAADVVVETGELGSGRDTIESALAISMSFIEHARLTGSASVGVTGDDLDNTIEGNAGANSLAGAGGADSILGGAGADTLDGGAGDDVLQGGADADSLVGGIGADTLTGGEGADTLSGGAGRDVIDGEAGSADLLLVTASWASSRLAASEGGYWLRDGDDSAAGTTVSGLPGLWHDRLTGIEQISFAGVIGNIADAVAVAADEIRFEDPSPASDGGHSMAITARAGSLIGKLTAADRNSVFGDSNSFAFVDAAGGLTAAAALDALTLIDGEVRLKSFAALPARNVGDHFTFAVSATGLDGLAKISQFQIDLVTSDVTTTGTNGPDSMLGGDGNDALDGRGGDDSIAGGDGADSLIGGSGWDTLDGQAGDDLLQGDRGLDMLSGGAGADTLFGGGENDRLDGQDGNDSLSGEIGDDTVLGGLGADTISGGGDADNLDGGDGDDSLLGGAGDDTLTSGLGADSIDGGDGEDHAILGGVWSADQVTRVGNTIIIQDDTLKGVETVEFRGAGATGNVGRIEDVIGQASTGLKVGANDIISLPGALPGGGSLGRISVTDANSVFGETYTFAVSGLYRFTTGSGSTAFGNIANVLAVQNGELVAIGTTLQDGMQAGRIASKISFDMTVTGQDSLTFTKKMEVEIRPVGQTIIGDNSHNGWGPRGGDPLEGGIGDDLIQGLGGNDYLIGNGGSDTLEGGDNADFRFDKEDFSDNAGSFGDRLDGGAGADTFVLVNLSVYLEFDAFDTISTALDTFDFNTRTLRLEGYDDALTGFLAPKLQLSGSANATITGKNNLRDNLFGNQGHDTFYTDNDLNADARWSADSLAGGAGNDTYYVSAEDMVTEEAGNGTDTIITLASRVLDANIEKLILNGDADVSGTGNALDNVIFGNAGANRLMGGAGNDQLMGGDGIDTAAFSGKFDAIRVVSLGSGRYSVADSAGTDTLEGIERIAVDDFAGDIADAVAAAATGISISQTLIPFNGGGGDLVGVISVEDRNATFGDINTLRFGSAENGLSAAQAAALFQLVPDGATTQLRIRADQPSWAMEAYQGQTLRVQVLAEGLDGLRSSFALDLSVEATSTVITGTDSADTLTGGRGNDRLDGLAGDDSLSGGERHDTLDGGLGADTMVGGSDDDSYYVDHIGDRVIETPSQLADTDTVFSSIAEYTLPDNVEVLQLVGAAVKGIGNAGANRLVGTDGDNVLDGAGLNDTLVGGAGNDTYYYYEDPAGINGRLRTFIEERPDGGIDEVIANTILDTRLAANIENITLLAFGGFNGLVAYGNQLGNRITGTADGNSLFGNDGADTLRGLDGGDELVGGNGNDVLDGGLGDDTMSGDDGDDTYVVDSLWDVITESGAGFDTVRTSLNWTLGANIEALELTGDADLTGTGDEHDNALTGNAGANLLRGEVGADTIAGGAGADTLVGGAGDDVLDGGEGGDVAVYAARWADVVVTSSETGLVVTDRRVAGTSGHEGVDQLSGIEVLSFNGVVGTALQAVAQAAHHVGLVTQGDLRSVGAPVLLQPTMAAGAVVADFLGLDVNQPFGDQNSFQIADVAGNPADVTTLLEVKNAQLVVKEGVDLTAHAGREFKVTILATGTDGLVATAEATIVISSSDRNLTGTDNAEALSGDSGNDMLSGLGGNDTLDGGTGGADTLRGGTGDDRYIADASDVIIEAANGGIDLVSTMQSHTLADHVENLLLGGTGHIQGTGNDLANVITGSDAENLLSGREGADTLEGGGGADTLRGGDGNDVLKGGRGSDLLVGDDLEAGSGNSDTAIYDEAWQNVVVSTIPRDGLPSDALSYVVAAPSGTDTIMGVELITFNGVTSRIENARQQAASAIALTDPTPEVGGAITLSILERAGSVVASLSATDANSVFGDRQTFSFADREGGLSAREASVLFEISNDRIVVKQFATLAQPADLLLSVAATGLDQLSAVLDFTVSIVATGVSLVGSPVPERLSGNAGADTLDGGEGDDSLFGLGGNDSLIGGAGNDALDGGIGADSMVGGTGDDTYTVDHAGDVVEELAGGGSDRVLASVNFTLGAELERLSLTGITNINGTGNGLANRLDGNAGANILDGGEGNDALYGLGGNDTLLGGAGNDVLDGGIGADRMLGGTGGDTYTVDHAGDVVEELAGGGSDRVLASVNFTLGAELERLSLTGSTGINGTGNGLANRLDGNAGANSLDGGEGNDALYGLGGNDSLIGGAGRDVLDGGIGADTLLGGAGNDALDGGIGADSMVGGEGDDTYTVDHAGDVVEELPGGGSDQVRASVTFTLGAELERLSLTGSTNINGTGNGLANRLDGNAGANSLDGGEGNDSLYGLDGNDTLIGGAGEDLLEGDLGADSITGGLGADRFVYRIAAEASGDVIADFSVAQGDRIDLRPIDANPGLSGNQAFAWIGDTEFGHVAGQLRFASGMLEGDVNGDSVADFQIGLSGVASLSAANIWL
jgi:Ca2+-binding RTX toxin-like protein